MPVAGLVTLFQSCTQQTKPGRTDWFRKMGRTVKTHVRVCWDLAIIFLTPYPPSSFWSFPLELWLGIYYGAVGHLPPRACLNAFLHGQSFPVSTPALPALLNATRSLLLVWRLQWPPRRGKNSACLPWYGAIRSRSAPRHNSPGSAPKNALSSTALLSNVCLPPVRLKLATSVPLAILTHAKHHVQSLKTYSFTNGHPPLPTGSQKAKAPKWLTFCSAYKDKRKISGSLQRLMAHKQTI